MYLRSAARRKLFEKKSEIKHVSDDVHSKVEHEQRGSLVEALQEGEKNNFITLADNNIFNYTGDDKHIQAAIAAINAKNARLNDELQKWQVLGKEKGNNYYKTAADAVKIAQNELLTALGTTLNASDQDENTKLKGIHDATAAFKNSYGNALTTIRRKDRKQAMKWGAGWGLLAAVIVVVAVVVIVATPIALPGSLGFLSLALHTPIQAALSTFSFAAFGFAGAGALGTFGAYMKMAKTGVRGAVSDVKTVVDDHASELAKASTRTPPTS